MIIRNFYSTLTKFLGSRARIACFVKQTLAQKACILYIQFSFAYIDHKQLDSMATAFKRKGITKTSAMLVTKEVPNWNAKTLLCRFMEKNGTETAFILSEGAIQSFEGCKEDSIYDLEIPGTCVRVRHGASKFGVFGPVEIRAKLPCKVQLSETRWIPTPTYEFVAWGTLQQKHDGDFIDIVGRVWENPFVDPTSSLPKKCVTLSNGSHVLSLDFLGSHSQKIFHKDDIVIIRSAVIKEYQQTRNAQTTYLSVIEINRPTSAGVLAVPREIDGQPKKKALRISPEKVYTVAQLKTIMEIMGRDASARGISERKRVCQDVCVRAGF